MRTSLDETRVVLIAPRGSRKQKRYPPIGLLSIAAVLESHGYSVVLIDLPVARGDPMPLMVRTVAALLRPPLAVGISVCTESAADCGSVVRLIQRLVPETKTILGGPHVTACPEEALSAWGADIVVRGEGESAIIEVLEAIRNPDYDLSRVRGIVYRSSTGAIRCTPERPRIAVLDQLPFPAYNLDGATAATGVLSVLSTRGCPGRCIFCSSQIVAGSLLRCHGPEWMFSLVYAQHRRQPYRFISVLDDTFAADVRRLRAFCELLKKWEVKRPWAIRTRADTINDELVRTLAEAGCVEVHIGIESGDDRVLQTIGKRITLTQVRRAIRSILGQGLLLDASFIIGHPADTLETIEKTLLLAMAIREFAGAVGAAISTPYPGTPLHRRSAELGIRIIEGDWRRYDLRTPIYAAPGFTLDDLARAELLFRTRSFFDCPSTLLTGNPHRELRQELAGWVHEMKHLRDNARPPLEFSPMNIVPDDTVV